MRQFNDDAHQMRVGHALTFIGIWYGLWRKMEKSTKPQQRRRCMKYKTMGLIRHDRALNGRPS